MKRLLALMFALCIASFQTACVDITNPALASSDPALAVMPAFDSPDLGASVDPLNYYGVGITFKVKSIKDAPEVSFESGDPTIAHVISRTYYVSRPDYDGYLLVTALVNVRFEKVGETTLVGSLSNKPSVHSTMKIHVYPDTPNMKG